MFWTCILSILCCQMMKQVSKTVSLLIACIASTAHCTPTLTCPDVAYLGDSARLSCFTSSPFSNLQYSGPRRSIAPQCIANWSSCSPVDGFNGSFINRTHTILKILNVQSTDAGLWTCEDADGGGNASCDLRVKNNGPADANGMGTPWIIISVVTLIVTIVIIAAVIVAVCVLKRRKQQSNGEEGRSDQKAREEVEPTYDTIAEPVSGPNEAIELSTPTRDLRAYACVDIVHGPIQTAQSPVSFSNHVNKSGIDDAINRSSRMKNDDSEKKVGEVYATVNKKKERDKKESR